MFDKKFIKIAIKFLKYSFEDINYDYYLLSLEEQQLVTEDEFNFLVNCLKNA